MNREEGTVRLSGQEVMYLQNSLSLPDDLARFIESGHVSVEKGMTLSPSREIAERFREIFTERLAKVGFDKNYEPTAEGRILEGLIDRFYIK